MTARRTLARKKAAPSKARVRAKTKALAASEPVIRETVNTPSLLDRQMALFRAMMAWSPMGILIRQQATIWERLAAPANAARKRIVKAQ
jgi:hypothetical protein